MVQLTIKSGGQILEVINAAPNAPLGFQVLPHLCCVEGFLACLQTLDSRPGVCLEEPFHLFANELKRVLASPCLFVVNFSASFDKLFQPKLFVIYICNVLISHKGEHLFEQRPSPEQSHTFVIQLVIEQQF